jgi:hypothetical protein
MYGFLRKNNKKLMAIFAAFLMVAFIADIGMRKGGGGRGAGDHVLGHLSDGEKLLASDFQESEAEWRLLTQLQMTPPQGARNSFGGMPVAYRLGQFAAAEIQQHPRLFLLLQREARRMGVGVSADRVNDVMVNELDQSRMPTDRASRERIHKAIESLLLVENAFQRAASTVKVSEPAIKHELALRGQNITVNAVEFTAAAHADKVAAPTPQQVQQQFEKFAKVDPKAPANDNPFAFGYRYPNRVKLQYISIPRADVRKAIEATKNDYGWEVEAQKYYLENQQQFPTTRKSQPEDVPFGAAGPTTSATRPTSQAAAPEPTTRPFEEVKADAKDRVINPEVDRKMVEIQNRITVTMQADYQKFRTAAGGATQPTTANVKADSSLGVAYGSYEYMQKLAQTIQKEFKILPTVASFDDEWRSADQLAALPAVGASFDQQGQTLSAYLTEEAAPFLDPSRKDDAAALAVLAPSHAMRDHSNNVYIVRLTAAEPAHAPASVAEVQQQVATDVKTAAAFEAAKADANKALEQARQAGLKQAAQSASRSVLTVGPFSSDVRGKLPGFDLKDTAAYSQFARGAFKLLSTPTSRPSGQPVVLVELQKEGKVYVVELVNVERRPEIDPQMAMFGGGGGNSRSDIERELTMGLHQYFQTLWFNFDDAKKRLGYASAEPAREEKESSNAPRAPLPSPLPM